MEETLTKQLNAIVKVIQERHGGMDDTTAKRILANALKNHNIINQFLYETDLYYLNWERKYTYSYPATFEYLNNGEVRVTFPDFAAGITYAASMEEAILRAEELLTRIIDNEVAKEKALPEPSSIESIEPMGNADLDAFMKELRPKNRENLQVVKVDKALVHAKEIALDTIEEINRRWDVEEDPIPEEKRETEQV